VAAITALVPLVKYTGSDWPIAAMTDGTPSSFEVTTKVFLRSERQVHGVLTVNGSWGASVTQQISLNGGEVQVVIKLRADSPKLWWTRGMGPQAMYNVSAFFQAEAGSAANVSASRRIGFRHLALVTVNDSDASVVAASRSLEGNGNHTLMLRLNGVPVFGKGSNMVPMEALEGRYVSGMHTQIVRSAVEAGMTLLRVWGGGIYPLDEWFDACDEAGVLSMVDMMYGTDGQMPMARATRKLLQISQDFMPYYP
jgi:beta-mannosidase